MLLLFASSGAQAQCTSTLPTVLGFDPAGFVPFARGGSVSSLVSVLNTTSTAFLNQTNAFVSAPPNPQPNQMGGGVWARGIGGRVDTENTGVTSLSVTGLAVPGNVICNTETRTNFAGYQAGADLARLNIGGWNIHGGVTVGYVDADATDRTPGSTFTGSFQVPFAGIYGAATYGGFFIDAQVRGDFFANQISDPANGVFNQNFNARGVAVSANIGYNHSFGNWFVEPSAGITWSKVEVDPFNVTGTLALLTGFSLPGTVAIDDIESTLGRLSLRVGTTFATGNFILQPFVTASVLHEFSGDVTTRFRTCLAALIFAPCGTTLDIDAIQTTSRVGTYGQFALGLAGQLANTGWLGYARVDVRTGENIDGVSVNGGLRYQFTPEQLAAIAGKGPVYKAPPAPVPVAYNWTGFYIGGYAGTLWGDVDQNFVAALTPAIISHHYSGFIGGGQIGFNYQIGAVVLGVEGDIGGANAKGATACPNVAGVAISFFLTCETRIDTLGSVTGRIGYAWERALIYAKGGWAAGDVEVRVVPNATGGILGFAPPAIGSKTASGFTVGGGFEFGLTPNWSAKAEYMYFDLGTERINAAGIPIDADVTGNVVKVGLNYRFTGLLFQR